MNSAWAAMILTAASMAVAQDGGKQLRELTEKDCLRGFTTKEIPVYKPGEEILFQVELGGFAHYDTTGFRLKWERTGDDGRKETGETAIGKPFVYRTSLGRPGFVRFLGKLVDGRGNPVKRRAPWGSFQPIECDLGAGVDILEIRQAVKPPADFDVFWQGRKAKLKRVPFLSAGLVRIEGNERAELFTVKCPCAGGKPVTGFLTVPVACAQGKKFPALVSFYGYNASWTRDAWGKPDLAKAKADCLHFAVSAHGFDLMKNAEYYSGLRKAAESNGHGYGFDPVQNSDPEKTYYCGMTYRVMRALEYIKTRPEWNGKELKVTGGSMGGMQSVWAAALDPGVTDCEIYIPWNCDIGGTELGRNRGDWHVKWVPALGYYDTASMATRVPESCDVTVTMAGLGDYICPPAGVMAFYNNLKCKKTIAFRQNTRHGGYLQPGPVEAFRITGESIREMTFETARKMTRRGV